MDVDGSGSLDTMELASALRARFGVTASIAELTRMLSAADTDGNGTLEVDEFEDVVRDVLAKAADRAVRVGQPPRQAELQRGRRHSLGRAAQRVEKQVLLKVVCDFTEQLHPERDDQVKAIGIALQDTTPSPLMVNLEQRLDQVRRRNKLTLA